MKKLTLPALTLLALMGALAAPAQAQNLAIVNGKPIPMTRVDALVQQVSRSGRPVTPEMMEELKKATIDREVLVQEAQKQGLEGNAEFKSQMDAVRAQVEITRDTLLIRQLVTDFKKNNPVSDAEIQAEYDKFLAASSGGKEYRAQHILVEKEDQAKSIIAQLKKGTKFDALAKKLSKDPGSAANGGMLDWAPGSGVYAKEFSDAMVQLAKGKYTEAPVKTQYGYHVIRMDDVRDAKPPKLEEIKDQIAEQLSGQKLMKFQQDLRAKAKIE